MKLINDWKKVQNVKGGKEGMANWFYYIKKKKLLLIEIKMSSNHHQNIYTILNCEVHFHQYKWTFLQKQILHNFVINTIQVFTTIDLLNCVLNTIKVCFPLSPFYPSPSPCPFVFASPSVFPHPSWKILRWTSCIREP